jgi:DNA-binding NtrC family response regulator
MPVLKGCRVLVVEDDYFIAVGLADALRGAGAHIIGPVANVRHALDMLGEQIDVCSLDFRLGGETSLPIADELERRGVPFIFATGTVCELPAVHGAYAVAEKPFCHRELTNLLAKACR